jgi:protein phosphatase 1B
MGNILNRPKTKKKTERGPLGLSHKGASLKKDDQANPNQIRWAASSMQGWRLEMEDERIAVEFRDVKGESGELFELDDWHYFFAIFDGHGGKFAARYAREHIFSILLKRPEFIQYACLASSTRKKEEVCHYREKALLQRALEDTFVELDLRMLREMENKKMFHVPSTPSPASNSNSGDGWYVDLVDPEWERFPHNSLYPVDRSASGTTVTATLVTPRMILCANVGDSRTVLDGSPLSTDHTPSLPEESERIMRANGLVVFDRVEGLLAVSRALGDFEFKGYSQHHLLSVERIEDMEAHRRFAKSLKVSPFPDVTCHARKFDVHKCLVLACDGIWDVMSNVECNKFIERLREDGEEDTGLIAEEALDACLKKGSSDNMTILICLLDGQSLGPGGGGSHQPRKKSSLHR